ncbi:DUF411 domain-containing protein [Parasphingopyxis lamellibrachiae]|uniref:Metal-binding protein n=1 Tax=Parasphingopyxis lamellibrachiae TaxID=680125 RepID=A0A3D9FGL3_9SPHN|nr:DUF411 domain-containing protein [Parasphingopyxis lamellibrachiae]RED16662.1 hypothetical protein DFR46_1689 [Parasphingopyxis lamellibrachiae]
MTFWNRRHFLAVVPAALMACSAQATPTEIVVHKSPSCGCCNLWIDHVRAAGFQVRAVDVADTTPIATRLGVPANLRSCHTAEIGGYVIEGHVPAREIRRLLTERSDAAGLAVPGMPLGSPGMEMGDRRENYDVILFDRAGGTRIFASY